MIDVPLIIAQGHPTKRHLTSAYGLWWITVAIGIVLLLAVIGIMATRRGRQRANAGTPRKRRRPIPDAWAEAGRRVEPIRMDEPEPPTAPEP